MDQHKVNSLKLCILWTFFAVVIANIEQNDHLNIDHSFDELSTHLHELENRDLCTSKHIVLIAGNVQTNKLALISHLTDPNLIAGGNSGVHVDTRSNLPVDDDTDTDNSNQINECNYTNTIIPRLISDKLNGIDYYNCPSVGAQQTIEHDIVAMESVKKLLNCSPRRMKLVFTINLPPNRMFEVSRADFLSLAEQATTLIKNITKYRNSTMLVVSEFQDAYTNNDGQYQFIDDNNMIGRVVTFLHRIKHSLEGTNRWYPEHIKAKIIEFINILLEKQDDEYMRIGISRLQLHDSSAKNFELLYEEKQRIISILNYRLEYVAALPMDFNTAITDEMENHIRQRIVDVQNHLSHDVNSIDLAIKEFYAWKETNMSDVYAFDAEISAAILKLSTQIRPDQQKPFIGQIISIINELNISISDHYIDQFAKHIEYIDLVKNVTAIKSNANQQRIFIPITPLKSTIRYLNDMKKWYSFVIKLSTGMDRYEAQQQISLSDVGNLLGNCNAFDKNSETHISINDIGLAEFAVKIDSGKIYQMVANMTVNGNMLNALKMAVGWAFRPIRVKCTVNKFTVMGYNVKISELISNVCLKSAKIIEVFAWNKLFIDADINKIGQRAQIAFIAPIWEIIGERRVILSGENAQVHTDGVCQMDEDGRPGLPGGSSGHFIGIGNAFTNDQQLEVVTVGGKGGDGENGRDRTINLTIADQHRLIVKDLKQISDWFNAQSHAITLPDKFSHGQCTGYRHYSPDDVVSLQVICDNEQRSENSRGLGGSGGVGGNVGQIVLIGFEEQPKICIVQNAGENGEPGKAIDDGLMGYNSVGLKVPEIVEFHPLQLINDFSDKMRMDADHLFRMKYFQRFLTQLSESQTIQLLIDKDQDSFKVDETDHDFFVIN